MVKWVSDVFTHVRICAAGVMQSCCVCMYLVEKLSEWLPRGQLTVEVRYHPHYSRWPDMPPDDIQP